MRRVGLLGLFVGLVLFGWAMAAVGWSALWQELRRLGWRLAPIVAFYIVIFGLDTWGWRCTFSDHHRAPWRTLFWTRLAGEAVNYVTPLASLGGEPVKAYLLRRRHGVPLDEGVSSVVIAKTLLTIGLLLFALCGVGLALWQGQSSALLARLSGVTLGVLGGLMLLFVVAQRRGLFGRLGPVVRRLVGHQFANAAGVHGHEIDAQIRRFYRAERGRLALSFGCHFLGWVAGAVEVWLVLQWLGIPVTLLQAWVIESLWQLLKAGAFFIPAALGAQEGGIVLIFLGLGLSLSSGLALGMVRRLRELVWTALGLVAWSRYEYRFATSGGGVARG